MPMIFIYCIFLFFFFFFCVSVYYLGTHQSKDTLSTQGSNQLYPPNPFLNADVHTFYTTESAPPVMPKNMNLVEKEAEKEAMNINQLLSILCVCGIGATVCRKKCISKHARFRVERNDCVHGGGGAIKEIFKKYIKINHNTKFSKFGEA